SRGALMPSRTDRLTHRERECLRLVHAHQNSKQIARRLGIKPSTVDRHCENAARKLNAAGRVDAALLLLAEQAVPNDSVSETLPIPPAPDFASHGVATGVNHDRHRRTAARHQLDATADGASRPGGLADEADDGPASGGGNPQTGDLPDPRKHVPGNPPHWSRPAGLRLPAGGVGYEHLGRILFVFAIAAIAVLVMTSVIGAERFAFLLQDIRYGG
ncbi:MAG: helix-turn-helix transcriptional regulator, partial [Alphaproteobacteria bacterium]|nr:helix-turn-helix transcriptional regulator [Alphaproteobacteria bacterium]